MPRRAQSESPPVPSTRQRLVDAALALLESEGLAGVTASALARKTGLSVSATNYSFGGQAALIEECYRQTVEKAVAWWSNAVGQLAVRDDARGIAGWLGTVVEQACRGDAFPVLVLQELFQAAPQNETFRAQAHDFVRRLIALFDEVAESLAAPDGIGLLLASYVLGMIYSRIGAANPAIDLPMSMDAAQRLIARSLGQRDDLPGWDGWCQAPEPSSILLSQPVQGIPSVARMLEAAATILGRSGPGGLTHRAVAALADCSLANVAYHFPTKDMLVRSTFAWLVKAIIRDGAMSDSIVVARRATAGMLASGAAHLIFDKKGMPRSAIMAIRIMILTASRDETLDMPVTQIRLIGQESTLRNLKALGTGSFDRLDAHISLMVTTGLTQLMLAEPIENRRRDFEKHLEHMVTVLFQ